MRNSRRLPSRLATRLAPVLLAATFAADAARAQVLMKEPPEAIRDVTVEEHLGARLPLRVAFTDSDGRARPLSDWFAGEKPAVVALVYYGCPVVCPLVLNRMTESFAAMDYTIGEDFNVVVLSIDHTEGPTEAAAAKMRYTKAYGRGEPAALDAGWAFLTGDEQSVRQLADACGWAFNRLPNGEYAHPTAIMVASPDGVLTRYVYGFDFPSKQMKLSLLDASEGKIAQSLGDRLLHYCYRYDPTAGAYSMEAMAVMRVAGALTVVGLAVFIGGMLIGERIRRGRREDARAFAA